MKLSVLLTTYNHAPFIGRALEGVAAQITDFDYEIVIADDCSDDGTREIVREFAERHPEQTRLILPDSNLGDAGNPIFFRQLAAARGEYTALLDGDDYWTAPDKLQVQVDFLDAHPECSTCFHGVEVVYEDGQQGHRFHQDRQGGPLTAAHPKPFSTVADILHGNFIPTCSAVFRTPGALPDWYYGAPSSDWPLHVLNAERGTIAYLDRVMAAYRIHEGGVWSMRTSRPRTLGDVEELVGLHQTLDRHLGFEFHLQVADDVSVVYEGAALAFRNAGSRKWARICASRSLRLAPPARLPSRWRALGVLVLGTLGRRS